MLEASSFTPLAEPLPGGQHRVLHPAFVDKQGGGITLFADVWEGMELVMLTATAERPIEHIPETAMALMRENGVPKSRQCIGALMIFCGGLVMAIDDDMPIICEKLATLVGYRDHVGLCCFGEQGTMCCGGHASHGNLMFGCCCSTSRANALK